MKTQTDNINRQTLRLTPALETCTQVIHAKWLRPMLSENERLKGPKWLSSGEHQLNITLNTQLHRRADAEGAKRFSLVKDN